MSSDPPLPGPTFTSDAEKVSEQERSDEISHPQTTTTTTTVSRSASPEPSTSVTHSPEHPVVSLPLDEESDVTDANGKLIYPPSGANSSEDVSRVSTRPSRTNLHITVPPKELQPWDLVDPPVTNGMSMSEKEKKVHVNGDGKGANGSTGHGTPNSRLKKMSSIRKIQKVRHPKIPKSSYYFGPPSADAAYGTPPQGTIGIHHPREILRVERDYSSGEIIQFAPIYPLELEGRINPTQFLSSINSINEILISAHSLRRSFIDNFLAVFTLQLSRLLWTSWYDKEMKRLENLFDELNKTLYKPAGLCLVWPRKVGFLFLEIEYY